MLIFSYVLLAMGSMCWALLVHESYIEEMWGASYPLLSAHLGELSALLAIACAVAGALLAGWHAIRRRSRRALAIAAIILNLSTPFIAYLSGAYVTDMARKAREEWVNPRQPR